MTEEAVQLTTDMESRDFHDKVLRALATRTKWQDEQTQFYQMREEGLRRAGKAEWQADLHLALVDMAIEKMRPFYYSLQFGPHELAEFASMTPQPGSVGQVVGKWFDYYLKNRSPLEIETFSNIDTMCLRGRGVMRVWWQEPVAGDKGGLKYEAVDPTYIIMSPGATDFDDADWFVHVKHFTVDRYLRASEFKRDMDLVNRIRGGQQNEAAGELEAAKDEIQGITTTSDPDGLILWECWVRQENNTWEVRTYSPSAPTEMLRDNYVCPYRWQGEPFAPYVSFIMELKDKGWYAVRGVAKRLAPYEKYACKVWNSKADHLAFSAKPIFTSDNPLPGNQTNFRFEPGQFIPGINAVQMPPPPQGLDDELNKTRAFAEQMIMLPDFGVGNQDIPGGKKTATEVEYIKALASTGVDMKGNLYKVGIRKLYLYTYAILLDYARNEAAYFTGKEMMRLDEQALHDLYTIMPSGTPDAWNRQQQLMRAVNRLQMFRGDPFINQLELRRAVIDADTPKDLDKLITDPQATAADEAKDEFIEVLAMMDGAPIQAKPHQDHQLRIRILAGKLQDLSMRGVPVDMRARQRLQEHMVQHVQMLKQQNPQAGAQIENAMMAASGDNTRDEQPMAAPPAMQQEAMPA